MENYKVAYQRLHQNHQATLKYHHYIDEVNSFENYLCDLDGNLFLDLSTTEPLG